MRLGSRNTPPQSDFSDLEIWAGQWHPILCAPERQHWWNRTVERSIGLGEAGALVARSVDEVFERSETILMMLANDTVIDDVLGRDTPSFERRVSDRTVVHMGTTSPQYSARLAEDVRAASGRYVEAPVSGSVKPAEDAQLVFMIAGDPADVGKVKALARPMSKGQIECGPTPAALTQTRQHSRQHSWMLPTSALSGMYLPD